MKKINFPISLLVFAFVLTSTAAAGEKYQSLRGETDIPAGSTPSVGMDWQPEDSSISRTFEHQPPLIPHDMEDFEISASQNDCLDCHGDKDSDAPMPHKTHYTDRDGKTTVSVSARWHFCTLCHVGQVKANPLVENTFQAK